ncbi:MAG: endonuclease/exonuclease/phosphatase family protein [Pseudomonadota bacterium]
MQVIWGFIAVTLVAIGLSFMGALHGIGDSLAVFRVGLCLLLVFLAMALTSRRNARLFLVVVAVAGAGTMLWHKLPLGAPGPITIYQKNMFHANSDLPGLAEDILSMSSDFVTLQEVSLANEALLDMLSEAYPHQFLCRYTDRSGIAVLSRRAPVAAGVEHCERRYGMARILVDLPQGRHYVAALHLSWPFPGQQPNQLRRLLADLEALDHPLLIGGDFNMVPWSSALFRIARASNTRHAEPARTTFFIGRVPISIDHVFAPGGGYVEARPLLGSDHFGLLARVTPESGAPEENN